MCAAEKSSGWWKIYIGQDEVCSQRLIDRWTTNLRKYEFIILLLKRGKG